MSEYWDDPYGLDADDEDDTYPSEVLQYLGVSGPGDEWSSHGPGGMSSQQVQSGQTVQPASMEEPGFFDSLFGDDEEPLVAEGGAAEGAANQVLTNTMGIEDDFTPKPSGGGGGFSAPAPAAVDPAEPAAPTAGFPVSKGTGAILLGIGAGVLFFMVKK